ncbi:MAG: M23 family metallopeptidase [Candidatus Pacebacteria bacterium]|nr:M23 family metallopeptidase [Candidatus Paceibacterota bacterium]
MGSLIRIGKLFAALGPVIVILTLTACQTAPSKQPPIMKSAPVNDLDSKSLLESRPLSPAVPKPAPESMVENSPVVALNPRYREPITAKPYLTLGSLKLFTPPEPGRLLRVKIPAGSRLWLREREIKAAANGWLVFALHRDSKGSVELELRGRNGGVEVVTLPLIPRSYDIQSIQNLPTEVVMPDPVGLMRIAEDSAKIRASRSSKATVAGYRQSLRWPSYGRISGIFGSQRILNGIPRAFHAGIDIAAPMGTELCAPADGKVSLLQANMLLTGNTLGLDHGSGVSSIFAHLASFKVKPGQRVRRGQLIATIGMTGRATGPHLHWGMFWNEIAFDPALLLPPPPETITAALNRCPIRK